MFDGKAFGNEMTEVVRAYVDQATAPLIAEIKVLREEVAELRSREPIKGADGAPGTDGRDGIDANMEELKAHLETLVAALPVPQDGKDGAPGADGRDGADGVPGLNGKDGRDGIDGQDGKDGRDGLKGEKGDPGADGVGLAGFFIDRDGEAVATLTNGEVKKLGVVVGRDGRDGARGDPGKDGFSLEDFDAELQQDGRTVLFSFSDGQIKQSVEMAFPVTIWRGIYAEGKTYEQGDEVTWAGSVWHCNAETTEKPGDGAKAWTLKVKRGRDGKDFVGPQDRKIGSVKI